MGKKIEKRIRSKIKKLEKELREIAAQIEMEHRMSNDKEFSVRQSLFTQRKVIEKRISALRRSFQNYSQDIGKRFIIEFNGRRKSVSIVLPVFANPDEGLISKEAPLAKALKGRNIGDVVEVKGPNGPQVYKVLSFD